MPVADYNSVTITQHGLENSQQNSQQIVSNFEECDSSEIAENHIPQNLDPIVSSLQLAQGGGGGECLSSQKTGTPQKNESAHSVEPRVPSEPEPSAPPAIGSSHKDLNPGDRVVITEHGNIHKGQTGEIVEIFYGSKANDYQIKLDKVSHNHHVVVIEVSHTAPTPSLMRLKSEGQPKKP